ncbi:Gfo/Idh/MocA family oxidoreductase [Geminicoccaceae bacterium 1502E]|nr:Gfo/Idh/MocA family oxidoreductase [Geminicoccaceae bacterium 1502E]
MNICMVGHGMMGVWHSDALKDRSDVVLHTLVGRREEPTKEFAARYGYRRWTLHLAEALADPAIDAVVVASPSEQHAAHALACIAAGKPILLEIPIAMSRKEAEQVARAAAKAGVMVAMCHPMRFRRERDPIVERLRGGEERLRHLAGRFFIPRLENVGATGYRRSWTDNILWHHFCHFIDLACFLFGDAKIRRVQSHMSGIHERTGIPMECVVLVETEAEQSFLVHGSYHASFRLYDKLLVTDRDTYLFDILENSLRTREGVAAIEDEKTNCARVTHDFVDALRDGRAPRAPAASALPAMRIIQRVQDAWDAHHGARPLPGRPGG